MRAVFSERKRKSRILQTLESRTDSFCFHERSLLLSATGPHQQSLDNLRVAAS